MTDITNTNASTDEPSNYEICDLSGFKAKRGELVPMWNGLLVLPEFWEPRNMQDFVKTRAEQQRGAIRPEPVNNPTFVDVAYPNGVSADDL